MTVFTKAFEKLEVSGTGDVVMENFSNLDEFEILKSGTSELEIRGSLDVLYLNQSGTGDVKAFDFSVATCNLEKTGTGKLEITVETLLQGSMSGTGDVRYKGDPTIDLDQSGTGDLINAN